MFLLEIGQVSTQPLYQIAFRVQGSRFGVVSLRFRVSPRPLCRIDSALLNVISQQGDEGGGAVSAAGGGTIRGSVAP